jgi:hypothetical protein
VQNIGLPESNYVQIALFGMVLSGTMGFHPVIKQLFSMIIWRFTTYDACSCIIASAKSVTVPDGNSLSFFDYSGLGTLVLENNASLYQSDDEIVNTGTIKIKRKQTYFEI